MCSTEAGKPHLLVTRMLDRTNSETIARVVNDALGVLWPHGVEHERVLLLVSDVAAYMVKAAKAFLVFYPNLLHVTCLAHALHNVTEVIRHSAPDANALVSAVKKVFRKSPIPIQAYKAAHPTLPMMPQPVATRWGTWLQAVTFLAINFEAVKGVVEAFDAGAAVSIEAAQRLFSNADVRAQVAYINANFSELPLSIRSLEESGLPLSRTLQILRHVQEKLEAVEGEIGAAAKKKILSVTAKNSGLATVQGINAVATGVPGVQCLVEPSMVGLYKFAPLVSVDVERSFSVYRAILADNRVRLTPKNIEAILVSHCNVPN